MGFFSNLFDWDTQSHDHSEVETTEINPASGLPMIDGIGSVDLEGNPFGTDSNATDFLEDTFSCSDSLFDNDFSCSASLFDDDFSCSDSLFDDDF